MKSGASLLSEAPPMQGAAIQEIHFSLLHLSNGFQKFQDMQRVLPGDGDDFLNCTRQLPELHVWLA